MAERKAPSPNPAMCSTPHSDRAHSRASFKPRGCDVEPQAKGPRSSPRLPLHTPRSSAADEPRQTDPHQSDTVALNAHCPIVPPGVPLPRAQYPTPLTVPSTSRLRIGDIGRTGTSPLTRFRSLFCLLERGRLGLPNFWMERKSWLFQPTFAQTCSAQFLHLVHIPSLRY